MSKLPMFRDSVPERLRFPLLLLLPFVYQCSNPLYMNIASDIAGDTSLLSEDVMMCGFACILGITVTFPLLFRLKFRFTTRQIILISSCAIIGLSLVANWVQLLPILVFVCFVFGIFKVWGTFECMSSMMQIISPNMHLAPFLTVVFLAVFGGVELGGLFSTHIATLYTWHHVTYALVGVHCFVVVMALCLMKDFRFKPAVPLKGIDWIGMALWSLFLLGLTALFVYGDTVEWFHNPYMRLCIAVSLIVLGLNIYRMHHIKEPFIAPQCFQYRRLWPIMILFFISGVMLASQSVLQNILTSAILHYPTEKTVNLNVFILVGVVIGCYMGKWGLTGMGLSYKQLTLLSILTTTMYVSSMFLLSSINTSLMMLALPCVFSGVGHALLFVVLTTYVESNTPFEHRFMMLSVLGLIRTGIASPIGAAFFSHAFRTQMAYNMPLYPDITSSMIASTRNLFGIATLIGLVTMIIIMASRYEDKRYITLPTLRKIYTTLGK